jgi:hypothetical protein
MRARRAATGGVSGMLCTLVLAACSGSGAGLDANGRPPDPRGGGGGATGVPTADFDSIQANVFTPICTDCHAGAGAPQGLRLDSANSYSLLVSVPSTEAPSILRVAPGDPDNSYIIQKLEGHAAVGAQMPYGGPPLSADVIAVIRQWIADGAQRSIAPASATVHSFGIVAVAPASGDALTESPPQIMVEVNREIDATRIGAASLRIERLVAVDGRASLVEIPGSVSLPATNPQALIVTPARPLESGHYRVVLHPESGYSLSSIGGDALAERIVTEFDLKLQP